MLLVTHDDRLAADLGVGTEWDVRELRGGSDSAAGSNHAEPAYGSSALADEAGSHEGVTL